MYEGDPAANLARAGEIATTVPPSTQQKYSNIGFQLLGEVVARVSGTPYAQRVRETILDPLGLASTSFEPLSADLAARCATGYAARAFSDDLQLSPALPRIEAEGGLWSCVEDLARWISAQFTEDVLPATTLAVDAPPPLPGGRGMDGGLGDRLVRGAARVGDLGAALGRAPRLHQ